MNDIAARATALTTAPLGCAFFSLVARLDLSPEVAADPSVGFHLLAETLNDVTVWRDDHAAAVAALLAEGPRPWSLAVAVLGRPEAAGWFGPIDRRAQLLAKPPGGTTAPHLAMSPTAESVLTRPGVPDGPPTDWERYAQKPYWGLFTSTDIGGVSSFLVGAGLTAGDLGPLTPPVARHRLAASLDARVFEVDGPDAWHRLCTTYPADGEGGLLGGLTVPDFGAVARDWDAVRVSLGGLLAADQVRVEGPAGWTELQGWDAEQTVWLRWAFDGVTRLPDLVEEIAVPVELR